MFESNPKYTAFTDARLIVAILPFSSLILLLLLVKFVQITTNLTDINGNLSEIVVVQGDIGQQNSMVTFSNVVMQKLTTSKCNIHIQFGIENLNRDNDKTTRAFNIQQLKNILGLNSLTFNPHNTCIRLINKSFTKSSQSNRSGYCIDDQGQILRFHKYTGADAGFSAYNFKDLCNSIGFLDVDGLYEIDIWGAVYS